MTEQKGRGWHGNAQGHAEAGRRGGQKTAATHGKEFYEQIGRRGGIVSPGKFQPGSQRAREAGRKGGSR